jgi:hypothetical protein
MCLRKFVRRFARVLWERSAISSRTAGNIRAKVVAYRVESVRPRRVRLASHLYQELTWVEPKTRQFALEILFYIISE